MSKLYHGTSSVHMGSILATGLPKGTYYGTLRVAEYYAITASEEDGGEPTVLEFDLSLFSEKLLKPDNNSIAEPLTCTLNTTEEEVWEAWEFAEGTWRESLDIVESVKYNGAMPVAKDNISV